MLNEQQIEDLKIELIKRKTTSTILAKELGISRQYLSGILNGYVSNNAVEQKLLTWKKGGK